MNNIKILTITGCNGSGKTELTFKIAKELEKNDLEICIVSFDTLSPLSTIKDNYEEYNVSLGYILTKDTNFTQRDIYTSMIPLTDKISIISYIYGDTKDKYPKILNNKVRDFLELLSGMVDCIIIDVGSNIIKPEIRQCLKMSDKILNIVEPTYKSVSYYKTFTENLERIDINNSIIINLLNKILYDTDYKKYQMDMNLRYCDELPYLIDLVKNFNNPFKEINNKTYEEKKYNKLFKVLMRRLYNIEYEEEILESKIEIKEQVKKVDINEKQVEIDKKINEIKNKKKNTNSNVFDEDDDYEDIERYNKNGKINKVKKKGLFQIFYKPKKEITMEKPKPIKKLYDEGDEF